MEEIHRQRAILKVEAEDIGVVALLGGGNALLLAELMYGAKLVAQARGGFKLLILRGGQHARGQGALQLGVAAFQKHLCVVHRVLVSLGRGQPFHARAQAAMNVVLQACARMIAREIDLAAWDQKAAMNQLDHAIGEIAWKVRSVVRGAVFAQPPRDKHLGVAVGERQLYVGVSLVVAQQNVEARLALLDEVIFKRQRFVLVGHQNVVEIDGLAHQRAGFGVGLRSLQQIRAHPRAQVFGLAHINHFALGVFVEIHAGLGGQIADFLVEIHDGVATGRPVLSIAATAGRAPQRPFAEQRLPTL